MFSLEISHHLVLYFPMVPCLSPGVSSAAADVVDRAGHDPVAGSVVPHWRGDVWRSGDR